MEIFRNFESNQRKDEWEMLLKEYNNLDKSHVLLAREAIFKESIRHRLDKKKPELQSPYFEIKSPIGLLMRDIVFKNTENSYSVFGLMEGVFTTQKKDISLSQHIVIDDFVVKNINGKLESAVFKKIIVEAKSNDEIICSGFTIEENKRGITKEQLFDEVIFKKQDWEMKNGNAPLATHILKEFGKLIPPRKNT